MKWYENKSILIAGFVILSLITGLSAYGLYRESKKPTSSSYQGTTTIDKTTGAEQEINSGRTDESYSVNPATPALIGFNTLIAQGITESDITTLQAGLSQYFTGSLDYAPNSTVALSRANCLIPDDHGYVNCTYLLTVNDTKELTGTLRTDLGGPVEYTISRDGKQIYSATQNPKN